MHRDCLHHLAQLKLAWPSSSQQRGPCSSITSLHKSLHGTIPGLITEHLKRLLLPCCRRTARRLRCGLPSARSRSSAPRSCCLRRQTA